MGTEDWQNPNSHVSPAAQVMPQPPQFPGSNATSTHLPPQEYGKSPVHVQLP